ncbi:MAG: terminase small subunit [Coprobacillus sp.]|nr:terminase small subunit [Coprobacillus sp.]
MTAKQKRFCDEYLIDLNATQAAIRAGYSKKSAKQVANENLTKPYLKMYIEERMKEKEDSLIAKQDEVLKYLTSVMRGESSSSVLALCGEGVQEVIDKPPDEKERMKAAELLGKRYRLFTDKVEVEGAVPIVIVDDIDD